MNLEEILGRLEDVLINIEAGHLLSAKTDLERLIERLSEENEE